MVKDYNAGDVIWINFDPVLGHEQGGHRPAVIVSPSVYIKSSGLMHVIPITSKTKGYPFEVHIKTKKIEGYVLVDQIKTIDWSERKIENITSIAQTETFESIKELLRKLLNI
jgi:mRNA interferase MazF